MNKLVRVKCTKNDRYGKKSFEREKTWKELEIGKKSEKKPTGE